MNNIHFIHELIKGKIAELIFAQMIRSTDASAHFVSQTSVFAKAP